MKIRTIPRRRIKERYSPTPTAGERTYHLWLIEGFPCACGCGRQSTLVHHPLTRHPMQRWRRDHEYVVPMADCCHTALHRAGKEDRGFAALAWQYRSKALCAGILEEV